jgi:hypothetical protein
MTIPHEDVAAPHTPTAEERRARRRGSMFGAIAGTAAAVFAVAFVGLTLWSPDGSVVVVELEGTDAAPDASALAVLTATGSGTSVELDVSDLAPAPAGSYYQGWMHGESGSVAIGSFHLRDGSDAISLWSGVAIEDYPVVMVTVRTEGDETLSGTPVLVGRSGD